MVFLDDAQLLWEEGGYELELWVICFFGGSISGLLSKQISR